MSNKIDWTKVRFSFERNLPNIITFTRILIVPVFVLILINPTPTTNLWATLIFFIASVSDWLDGYLARVLKAESILGKLLDPLADKILVTAALVMLASIPGDPRVPGWIVVILLSREMLINGLRSVAAIKGVVVPASTAAKHKTAFTMFAIGALLIGEPYSILGFLVDFRLTGTILLWIALMLSVGSGIAYFVSLRNLFKE